MVVQNLGFVCEFKNGGTKLRFLYVNLKIVVQNTGYVCESRYTGNLNQRQR